MTVMTARSAIEPLRLPRSPGRARVAAAAAALQSAVEELYREEREREAARERARKETDAKAKRLALMAEARQATREMRIEIDRKWFWDFAAEALDALRELAAEAKQHGQQMRAQAIESRIDAACAELDRIQKREASRQ